MGLSAAVSCNVVRGRRFIADELNKPGGAEFRVFFNDRSSRSAPNHSPRRKGKVPMLEAKATTDQMSVA